MYYGFNIKYKNRLYYVFCTEIQETKKAKFKDDGFVVGITYRVKDVETGEFLTWPQIKKIRLDEEIAVFTRNTVNGQRSVNWKKDAPNENGKFIRVHPELKDLKPKTEQK